MLGLFNKNGFVRKRKTKSITTGCLTAIESLEARLVLTSQFATTYSNGSLIVTGSGDVDDLTVTVTGTNSVKLSSTDLSATFSGAGDGGLAGFLVTGNLVIYLGAGGDFLTLDGGAGGTLNGSLSIDLGSGDNLSSSIGILAIVGDVSVVGADGSQSVSFGSGAVTDTFAAGSIRIDNGSGDIKLAYLDNTTVTGNVTITNSGTGNQVVLLGDAAPNSIGGNLVIRQSNAANTGGYDAQLQDTNVGGNVTIINGSNTAVGNSLVRITAVTVDVTIGGSATMVNGDNFSNQINLGPITMPPPPFTLSFGGNATLTNGAAQDPVDGNQIDVNNVQFTKTGSTISFTNGSGPNNDINMGIVSTNSFAGQVFATNNSGNLVAGTNDITIPQGVFGANLNLSNGINASAGVDVDNTVTLANDATPGVTGIDVTGNVVITNANTSTGGNNVINIGTAAIGAGNGLRIAQFTPANGSGSGNLTISNGTTSDGIASVAILGAAANGTVVGSTHAFDGNLSVVNRGSTAGGAKQIDLSGLTTFGRTGATLNNAGAGNSTINIGGDTVVVTVPVFFARAGGLYVQDGSGASELNIQSATFGTAGTPNQAGFRYSDFGGGVDTINISTLATSAVSVNGVTRFDTGAGSDTVTITQSVALGGGGSAVFNDSVFIALGSGDDTLNIGAFAACPAFSSANRFQFDGTQGVNTIAADPLSVAEYTVGSVPRKLRHKITGFRNILAAP